MKKKKRSRNSRAAAEAQAVNLKREEQHNTKDDTGDKTGDIPGTQTGLEPVTIQEKHFRTAGTVDYEFDTDFTGDDPSPIKNELDLFFDGQEKEKVERIRDEKYEADSAFGVVESAQGKDVLKNLWIQKNDMLRQKISENEKHLLFVKKKIENLEFAVKINVIIFVICLLTVIITFLMRNVIMEVFRPVYYAFGLPFLGIVAFLSLFSTGKVVRQYKYHVKRDLGWTKPHPLEEFTHRYRRAARERNYKAEYDKVNWVLRQYDYERELMFIIKTHIDNGEIDDVEELKRQLHDVLIYEDVEPAMK